MAVGSTRWRPCSTLPCSSTSTMSSGPISLQCSPRGLIRKRRLSSGSATLKWLHTPSLRPWWAAARSASARSSHSGFSIFGSAACSGIWCLLRVCRVRCASMAQPRQAAAYNPRLPSPACSPMSDAPLPAACDVLVVGAGPAGSACAQMLARAGLHVVLVDQHAFPRDKVCGDGLIPDAHAALRRLGVLRRGDGAGPAGAARGLHRPARRPRRRARLGWRCCRAACSTTSWCAPRSAPARALHAPVRFEAPLRGRRRAWSARGCKAGERAARGARAAGWCWPPARCRRR